MARVRCPKCATVVEVAPGESPVCPTCGFGRPEGAPAAPAPQATPTGPASPAAPAPAPPAGPTADPWGAPDHGYGAPTAPMAAAQAPGDHGQPGTVREPGIIVLLYIVTLGIYGLVWHFKTGVEVDRFRPETRASGVLKGYVWTAVAAYAAAFVGVIMIFGAFIGAFSDAATQDRDPTEDEVFDALFGAGAGFFILLLSIAASITAEVLKYIGMWRVWNMTADQQRRIGAQPINPTLLLLFLLSPLIVNVLQLPFAFIPILGGIISFLLGIGVIVVLILAYVWTQQGLNQVWRTYGAR